MDQKKQTEFELSTKRTDQKKSNLRKELQDHLEIIGMSKVEQENFLKLFSKSKEEKRKDELRKELTKEERGKQDQRQGIEAIHRVLKNQ